MAAEHELMEMLVSSYGKTIHTWHTDQERTLPVGSPMIIMGLQKVIDGMLIRLPYLLFFGTTFYLR